MKRSRITAVVLAAALFFSAAFSGCTPDSENTEQREQSRLKVLEYRQEVNEDGIAADLSRNPYYKTEQPGYEYSEPQTIKYDSAVTGSTREAMILLPEDYDEEKEYPVLYLLHGLEGSYRTWKNKDAHIILQNLWYFHDVPEMITVFADSSVNEQGSIDGLSLKEAVDAYDRTEEDLITGLMPYVESHYSVKKGRENTAVAGNSMGGRNALYTAFSHPDLFGYVGAFSSAHVLGNTSEERSMPALVENFEISPSYGDFEVLMVCVGRQDDVCGDESYRIHDNMTANGVKHIFYDMEGGHDDNVWQNALYNFGMRLFRSDTGEDA